ncbi:DUF6778 family protein [Yoonia sp.]|uniref:DUF6778 family protein n=1 Tax=Yoonia sp. TaxID=2212373 RepID=UPI0025CFD9B6|nr:DUF6778 family protein [Yoonia sp.]
MAIRFLIMFMALIGMAACDAPAKNRVGAFEVPVARSYALQGITFTASPDLRVSESDGFYPRTDVVWRGDPLGPRIAQIAALFETAAARNRAVLNGDVPVVADITLLRFHGVTNRTRSTVGGVYNIIFMMTVRDARSGAVIEPARRIVANLRAPGGREAIKLDDTGQTEKVRVTDFLTSVLRSELL